MLVYAYSTSLVTRKTNLCERSNTILFFSALFCFAVFKAYITRGNEFSCLHLLITSTEFSRLDEGTVATVLSVKACWAGAVVPLIYNLSTRLDE